MERSLLSSKELAEHYDDVVWMYLFQDFSSSHDDRAAQRVAIRFGISSWPQHFLVDPRTLEKVGDTGRSLQTFKRALKLARLSKASSKPTMSEFMEADQLAAQLGEKSDQGLAEKSLKHADVVVRYRAIEILAKKNPKRVLASAEKLLQTPHDQTRYLVCRMLSKMGDTSCARTLDELLRNPKGSRNQNVLRSAVATALARCGDARSLQALEPFASSGNYRNSLTKIAVGAVVKIVERARGTKFDKAVRKQASKILLEGFPAIPAEETNLHVTRLAIKLAEQVHDGLLSATRSQHQFPSSYSTTDREALIIAWRKRVSKLR